MRSADDSYVSGVGRATLSPVGHITEFIGPWLDGHRNTSASRKSAGWSLVQFARETGDPETDRLGPEHIDRWWRSISHLAASTRRKNHSIVRGFLNWLRARGALSGDPLASVNPPPPPRSVPRTLSPAAVDAMRHACTNYRDRAILELQWGMGLRCVEVARLEVADVDFDQMMVLIRGKGHAEDLLPLPQRVAWSLQLYLEEHPAVAGPLIRDRRDHRGGISPAWVSQTVANIGKRAGVKNARYDGHGAHGLRRTFATELLDSGANIRKVQAAMRHVSLASTERYLRRANANELREAMEHRIDITTGDAA